MEQGTEPGLSQGCEVAWVGGSNMRDSQENKNDEAKGIKTAKQPREKTKYQPEVTTGRKSPKC